MRKVIVGWIVSLALLSVLGNLTSAALKLGIVLAQFLDAENEKANLTGRLAKLTYIGGGKIRRWRVRCALLT
ncbi:hypothetical protein [Vibrio parahaemolyticus]|uniref:hypothetical protein n=1 Tax=Vibrio parahaemolyticus TaxID=670 RepID=UPI0015DF7A2E|nr:hypothetical protein [Vibrio parahaemolyticus]